MNSPACLLCLSPLSGEDIIVREMMFGSGAAFTYQTCMDCGSLQLVSREEGTADQECYPSEYYSFRPQNRGGVSTVLRGWRDRAILGSGTRVERALGRVVQRLRPERSLGILASFGLVPEMRILDVGCGAGHGLDRLRRAGYRNLDGIDPFLPEDTVTEAGVELRRAHLTEIEGLWDVIKFNHSLEHVPDPGVELTEAAARLTPGGIVIVRIPTVSSAAWEIYGPDWVQIDAPRHVFVPSREGMARVAGRVGLKVEMVVDDSTAFQFTGSELYRRGVPLWRKENGRAVRTVPEEHFSEDELKEFEARASQLNAEGRGDQAGFLLRWSE